MPDGPREILLVTPVWNDSSRLSVFGVSLAHALASGGLPIRWVIADDGSSEGERMALGELRGKFARIYPKVELHLAAMHHGKGSVIREAWALAPDADWLAFVDADGAVTAEDMLGLIRKAIDAGQSVIGVRKRTESTRIEESFWRGVFHRGFLITAELLLDLRSADIQCGAKVIKGSDYRMIERRLDEDGLAFDSELLSTLNWSGAAWLEVPVNWVEMRGGKVKPLKHAWGMLAALLRIRSRDW
jgi:hypothetical protein